MPGPLVVRLAPMLASFDVGEEGDMLDIYKIGSAVHAYTVA